MVRLNDIQIKKILEYGKGICELDVIKEATKYQNNHNELVTVLKDLRFQLSQSMIDIYNSCKIDDTKTTKTKK